MSATAYLSGHRPIYGAVATNTVNEIKAKPTGEPLAVLSTTGGWNGSGAHGGANYYVPISCEDADLISVFIQWFDGTSNVSAIEMQFTNRPTSGSGAVTDYDETDAWVTDSDITITGPAASAAGSEGVNVSNVGWRRARIKFTVSANTLIAFWSWGKD